ncbi:MAG: hypothetical protein ACJ8G1_08525 [Vitreoscilla sp.]|jgi:hypothetical protein
MKSIDVLRACAGFAFAASTLPAVAAPLRARLDPEVAIARDYVLASCLIKRYPDTPVAADAQVWAGGLVEQGHIAADRYARLAQLAVTEPSAVSRDGAPVPLLDCMTLYNDPKLPGRIARALRR